MPGGSRTPIEQWPTSQLVGVGSVIAVIVGFGLFVTLRGARTAWRQGDIGVVIGALAVSIFLSVWLAVLLKIGKELLRRWRTS